MIANIMYNEITSYMWFCVWGISN